jgi:glycosyltransferase involved in cell wall biosynthesis
MKIAMFSDSFYPIVGGRENVIDNSVKELIKSNVAYVCAPKIKGTLNGKNDNELPYKVLRCNSIKVGKCEYLSIPDKKFKKQVEQEGFDIIHCQTKYGLLNYAFKLRKKFNVPVITSIHTNYKDVYCSTQPKLIAKLALKYVVKQLNKCDKIVAISNYMKQQVVSLGVTAPITIIKNGVNFYDCKLTKQEQVEFVNKTYKIQPDDFVFLYVGRVIKSKNIEFQLETIKELSTLTNKKFKFVVVGNGKDENYFMEKCKQLKIEDKVIFTGLVSNIENLYAIYSRANIFYFASLTDNDPLTIVEAAFNSTPSLLVENTGGAERVVHAENGFVCEYNKAKFADMMLEILNGKYDLEKISKQAKLTIPESWETVTNKYVEEYKKTIKDFENK